MALQFVEKLAALVGDPSGDLSAQARTLAADDKCGLLRKRGRHLNLLQEAHGLAVIVLAAVKGGGLSEGLVHRLDGLVLKEARGLYFLAAVA
jgi:hypothetical protein